VKGEERLRLAAIAGALVEAYRAYGHLAAKIDPLGSEPPGHPMLDPGFYGVMRDDLASLPASAVQLEHLGDTVGEVLDRLERVYCGPIGYELDHVENPAERDWLVESIESNRHSRSLEADEGRALLQRLTEVEGLEQFLHRSYLGMKRFSIEGLDMLVPMLDHVLTRASQYCVKQAFLGMAHRGRLNVLAHIIGISYESILAEFEEETSRGIQTALPELGSGDVKYHIGARARVSSEQLDVEVHLAPNPSHLEHVDPVVLGMARGARYVEHSGDPECMLPILIHGDASFAAQGVVAETLNLSRLRAYETGGTIHLIANNQLGFTTMPSEGRSTRYASDLALGFRMPVVHVNADEPEACLAAVRLAVDYRFQFGQDLVIDLVGYRRYGHNEGDEPGFTQPRMYDLIKDHPTVRTRWADRLIEAGTITRDDERAMSEALVETLANAREEIQAAQRARLEAADGTLAPHLVDDEPEAEEQEETLVEIAEEGRELSTGVPILRLETLNEAIHRWPEGFEPFGKLERQLSRRRDSLHEALDWGHAEALALASLLTDGVPIRFTGEDTARGTFSHRHLVLHDGNTGETYTPLEHLTSDQAHFQVANSPLSEIATLGFEYGFSTIALDALVLWEAQFGDFANVGQAIIDQFISAGHTKWGQESRLVLLLPHGYEGQGPEHSSARLERFLQLAAQGNLRVVNCTTPAQYFHLLRLQARRPARRPLIVMTPKSLLRHPRARSSVDELAEGRFRAVLPDVAADAEPERIDRVLLCSGKVFYELEGSDERSASERCAVVRLEQLYPFPRSGLQAVLGRFPSLAEIRWVQEEPANMGAWRFLAPQLRRAVPAGVEITYVGRAAKASPAEGYAGRHEIRQRRIIERAFQVAE
jgi:2-oxoglutarate dehydrogenase E1 component